MKNRRADRTFEHVFADPSKESGRGYRLRPRVVVDNEAGSCVGRNLPEPKMNCPNTGTSSESAVIDSVRLMYSTSLRLKPNGL